MRCSRSLAHRGVGRSLLAEGRSLGHRPADRRRTARGRPRTTGSMSRSRPASPAQTDPAPRGQSCWRTCSATPGSSPRKRHEAHVESAAAKHGTSLRSSSATTAPGSSSLTSTSFARFSAFTRRAVPRNWHRPGHGRPRPGRGLGGGWWAEGEVDRRRHVLLHAVGGGPGIAQSGRLVRVRAGRAATQGGSVSVCHLHQAGVPHPAWPRATGPHRARH